MLLMISEICLQAEFTFAELARILAGLFSHPLAIAPVMAFELNDFIVDANHEPCRNPLGDKVPPFSLAPRFRNQGKCHCTEGNTKVSGRGYRRGIFFNRLSEAVFVRGRLISHLHSAVVFHTRPPEFELFVIQCGRKFKTKGLSTAFK
jgi:hypothetical protein